MWPCRPLRRLAALGRFCLHTESTYICCQHPHPLLSDAMRIYETMLDRGVAPTVQLKRILVEVCGLDKLSVMLSGTGEGA